MRHSWIIAIVACIVAGLSVTAVSAKDFNFAVTGGLAVPQGGDSDYWNTGVSFRGTGYDSEFEAWPNVKLGIGLGVSWMTVNADQYKGLADDVEGDMFMVELGPSLRYEPPQSAAAKFFGEVGMSWYHTSADITASGSFSSSYYSYSYSAGGSWDGDDIGINFGGGVVLANRFEIKPVYHLIIADEAINLFTLSASYIFGRN